MEEYKLYNGNCLEVIDKLIKEGVSVDITLTSPPYNRVRNDKYKNYEDNLSDEQYYKFIKSSIEKTMKISKYVFYNIQQTHFNRKIIHKIMGDFSDNILQNIIWVKQNPQPNSNVHSVVNSYEYIIVFSDKDDTLKATNLGTKNVVTTSVYSQNPYSKIHNAVMHPKIPQYIITNFTNKGDSVLDCFMGTGTTGEVAIQLQRKFIGIELDKEYFELSRDRLDSYNVQESFM